MSTETRSSLHRRLPWRPGDPALRIRGGTVSAASRAWSGLPDAPKKRPGSTAVPATAPTICGVIAVTTRLAGTLKISRKLRITGHLESSPAALAASVVLNNHSGMRRHLPCIIFISITAETVTKNFICPLSSSTHSTICIAIILRIRAGKTIVSAAIAHTHLDYFLRRSHFRCCRLRS
jgi:hypothetical protein